MGNHVDPVHENFLPERRIVRTVRPQLVVGKGPYVTVGNLHEADKYGLWESHCRDIGSKLRHNEVWDLGTLKYWLGN